jgi:hypothetical protein
MVATSSSFNEYIGTCERCGHFITRLARSVERLYRLNVFAKCALAMLKLRLSSVDEMSHFTIILSSGSRWCLSVLLRPRQRYDVSIDDSGAITAVVLKTLKPLGPWSFSLLFCLDLDCE